MAIGEANVDRLALRVDHVNGAGGAVLDSRTPAAEAHLAGEDHPVSGMEALDPLSPSAVLSGDLDPGGTEFPAIQPSVLGSRIEEIDVDVAGGGDEEEVLAALAAGRAGAPVLVPLSTAASRDCARVC